MTEQKNNSWRNLIRSVTDESSEIAETPIDEIRSELAEAGIDTQTFLQRFERERASVEENRENRGGSLNSLSLIQTVLSGLRILFSSRLRVPAVALAGALVLIVIGRQRWTPPTPQGPAVYRAGDHVKFDLRLADLNQVLDQAIQRRDYVAAAVTAGQVLELMRTTAGERHPDTARAMNNLALMYKKTGRIEEARRLYEEAITIQTAVLGADHPETRVTRENLQKVEH